MEQSAVETLPPVSSLSPSILSFLNDNLRTSHHLQQAPALLSELQSQSWDLDRSLSDLNQRLATSLLSYASYSGHVGTLFHEINANLSQLRSTTDFSGCISGQYYHNLIPTQILNIFFYCSKWAFCNFFLKTQLKNYQITYLISLDPPEMSVNFLSSNECHFSKINLF